MVFAFAFISRFVCLAYPLKHMLSLECDRVYEQKSTFLHLFIWTVDWNRTFWRYHIAHMNLQSMFVVIILKLCWPFFFRRRRPNGGEIHRENWIIFLWLTKHFFHIHNMQIACVWEREEEHIETYKRWLQHTLTVRWLYHQCKLVPRGIFFCRLLTSSIMLSILLQNWEVHKKLFKSHFYWQSP